MPRAKKPSQQVNAPLQTDATPTMRASALPVFAPAGMHISAQNFEPLLSASNETLPVSGVSRAGFLNGWNTADLAGEKEEDEMDTKIAQKHVDDLAAAMVAKGMAAPGSQLIIRSEREPTVYIEWKDKSKEFGTAYDCFSADTFEAAFEKAVAFIAAQPSPEQARLNEFMRVLGKAIDIGNQYGIEADYLNPLVASMKKLSENAITDQRAA